MIVLLVILLSYQLLYYFANFKAISKLKEVVEVLALKKVHILTVHVENALIKELLFSRFYFRI